MRRTELDHSRLMRAARFDERVDGRTDGDRLFFKRFPSFDGLVAGENMAIAINHDSCP